jgi:pimeloyl-ACP methyl ester carboxylesterase
MKKFILAKIYLVVILIICSSNIFAQTYNIGHISTDFYDNARNRNITTEIYYPSDTNGDNVPIYIGNFPIIVFGHGFLMSWDSYDNFWNSLVPEGYILCFPTTEMGFAPNHQFFAEDLSFIASKMQMESLDNSSIFYNSVLPKTGILGHSMGGGASFLAAENNPNINTLINFAAAETNPSAISAASNITIPSLIFSGDDDCVAPPINHQNIMFDSLNSNCKTQINIINGGHCYFANENVLCSFGESSCNPSLSILRAEQQSVTNDFLKIWLNYSLKSDQSSFTIFNDSLQSSNRITYSQYCNSMGIEDQNKLDEINIYPNPVIEILNIDVPLEFIDGELVLLNMFGQELQKKIISNKLTEINLSNFESGSYFIFIKKEAVVKKYKIVKVVHYR